MSDKTRLVYYLNDGECLGMLQPGDIEEVVAELEQALAKDVIVLNHQTPLVKIVVPVRSITRVVLSPVASES